MPKHQDDFDAQAPREPHFDPDTYLGPVGAKEDQIILLLETYPSERITPRRLGSYLEVLESCSIDELKDASRAWRKQRHKAAPSPGELLALIEGSRRPKTADPHDLKALEANRATPDEVNEAIAKLINTGSAFSKELLHYRQRYKENPNVPYLTDGNNPHHWNPKEP